MNQVNKEKFKTGVWGAICGAIMAIIIGFAWGGWVLGGTSHNLAEEMAQTAVVDRLVPMCVAQFNQDPQRDTKRKEFDALTSDWKREQYVRAHGWATMPFEEEPDRVIAERCAEQIMQNNQ
jgi:hypothetical protein